MRRTVSAVVTAAFSASLLAGCTGVKASSGPRKPTASASTKASKASKAAKPKKRASGSDGPDGTARIVSVGREDSPTWGRGAVVIHYEVANVDDEVETLVARLELLDKGGAVLGQTAVTALDVEPGATVAGETSPRPAEVRDSRVGDVAGARVVRVEDL